jgi:hypothetical protein
VSWGSCADYLGFETACTLVALGDEAVCDVLFYVMYMQIRKMDLEARSLQPSTKAGLLAKLREYKSDLNNLKSEVKRISAPNARQATREELLESGMADTLAVSALTYSGSIAA